MCVVIWMIKSCKHSLMFKACLPEDKMKTIYPDHPVHRVAFLTANECLQCLSPSVVLRSFVSKDKCQNHTVTVGKWSNMQKTPGG